jgi:hypothetical protein
MPAHGRRAQAGGARKLARASRLTAQEIDDQAPMRIGERGQRPVEVECLARKTSLCRILS